MTELPPAPSTPDEWKALYADPTADWYFTFGVDHAYGRHYVRIVGTYDSARAEMIDRHGLNWCMQNAEHEKPRAIDRFGLTELNDPAGDQP